MHNLPLLKKGDSIEIIAPASRCSDKHLEDLKSLIQSWDLTCLIMPDIFGDDLLCANSDERRFESLKNALTHSETKAIICARGGYGSMRLIPALKKIHPTVTTKLFIGMSDITALNLYLQQTWQWPTVHGALALDKFSPESIEILKKLLFGEIKQIEFKGRPLNALAATTHTLASSVTGGNLSIVQASIGTEWQMESKNKIIFLEEINERGYKVDRMLEHLRQAGLFASAVAIVFGDFMGGEEPNDSSLIQPVLERFAELSPIPVIQIAGIGHGYINNPIIFGTKTILKLGDEIKLSCFRM